MRKTLRLFPLLLILLSCHSCTKMTHPSTCENYCIGVDPSFFPTELGEQKTNVYAFTQEVLKWISEKKKISIQISTLSWDNLFDELALNRVDAVVSSAPPNLINSTKYVFSNPLLRTGPVLVVPKTSKAKNLSDLAGKVVATLQGNDEIEIIAQYPKTEFIFYSRFASALELVSLGNIQGALIPIVVGARYVEDLFEKNLKIVTPSLTSEALRLITLQSTSQKKKNDTCPCIDPTLESRRSSLISLYNEAINEMLDTGEYQKLLLKWNLSQ